MASPATPLKRARLDAGWTQEQLLRRLTAEADRQGVPVAELVSLRRDLTRWENGHRRVGERYQPLFQAVYGLSAVQLGFAPPPRITVPPAGAAYVDDLHATVARLVSLDSAHGGDDVLAVAERAWRSAHRRLVQGDHLPAVERDLQAAVGDLGLIASWVAHDAGHQDLARQLTHEALFASRAAGDRATELFERSHLAMLDVVTGYTGEAERLARETLEEGRLPGRVEALFRVRHGRALAQAGDRTRALDAFDRARALLADGIGPRDPRWAWWFDGAELAWHKGMALVDLGDRPAAVDQFWAAADERPVLAARARWNDFAHLLDSQVAVSSAESAEVTAGALARSAGAVASTRTTRLLQRTAARAAKEPAMAGVAEQLEAVLGV